MYIKNDSLIFKIWELSLEKYLGASKARPVSTVN